MLTYSPAVTTRSRATSGCRHAAEPWPPRAGALRMPNRRPEKTFVTSCRPQDPRFVYKTLVLCKIRRIQMRNRPRVEPNSTSRKRSPAIHFRRQVGTMAPSSLRVFRDLIIFRENRRKCASIRSARPVPCPAFSVINFSVPSLVSSPSFPVPDHCHSAIAAEFLRTAHQLSASVNNSTVPCTARKMQLPSCQRLSPINTPRTPRLFGAFTP